ncbi:MAG: DUF1294 domain-containing protein [Acutalibacteraceae bacterium]|nr:DUF1294 domain-containing protein [Clostridiales bacterium]
MPHPAFWLTAYFLLISLIAITATLLDKYRARRHKWRIPEATLLLLSALGGSAAMLITMRLIHHKTRKKKFMIGIPVILILQLAAAAAVFWLIRRPA